MCMKIVGLIPFKSATDHPVAPLWLDMIWINFFSWSQYKRENIITGKISLELRNTFLIESGRGFNWSLGGETIEDGIGKLAKGTQGS